MAVVPDKFKTEASGDLQVFSCSPKCPTHRRARRDGGPVIDIHCHLRVPTADRHLPPQKLPETPSASDRVNAAMMQEVSPRLDGLELRLADMDRLGIDIQALSPSPGQYYYGAPLEAARLAIREVNEAMAGAVARHPHRFVGMGVIPMQEPQEAVFEMRRCRKELGLKGIEIGTNVGGRELADPAFAPVFQAAEALDLLLFLHPMGFTEPRRLAAFHLANVIGNPLDSTVAVSHLVFGGVLERHPDLKVCVAHGGGYIGAYAGRMEHAWHHRDDCRQCANEPPSRSLARLYFDTLVFERQQLDALVARWGANRLCLGSDYPFDMAEPDPLGFHDALPDDIRDQVVGGNAQRLLGLTQADIRKSDARESRA